MNAMALMRALASLDPAVEDHWTAQGLPRVDYVIEVTGDATITRNTITSTAPDLLRSTAPWKPPVDLAPRKAEGSTGEGARVSGALELQAPGSSGKLREAPDLAVLDRPLPEVLSSLASVREAMAALEVKMTEAAQQRAEVAERLEQLTAKHEMLKRAEIRHQRASGVDENADAMRDYLRVQNEERAKRAEAAKAFLAGGTTMADVAARLGPSPIDAAQAAVPRPRLFAREDA